jgi:hypothetical protein
MLSIRIALAVLLSLGTGLHARISLFSAPLNPSAPVDAGQAPARTPDVHFVPTPPAVVDGMLKLAVVKASDVVYDLGSGDGRIVIAAAQKFGARGVGIELDRQLVSEANKKAREAGVADKVTFLSTDLFKADISEATVVTLYLTAPRGTLSVISRLSAAGAWRRAPSSRSDGSRRVRRQCRRGNIREKGAGRSSEGCAELAR